MTKGDSASEDPLMKHQYFGDINDYRKYGLLYGLSGKGVIRTGICWMLTGPDGRSDGEMLAYLDNPEGFRPFAPHLFDLLHQCVRVKRNRHTSWLEASICLPSTNYFSSLIPDDHRKRKSYFARMLRRFADVELIFFDPDNGFEIKSKPIGRKGSSKYLSWCELQQTFDAGHSVLVYQHFPRENRTRYIKRLASTILERTTADAVFTFRTPRVVFFLASRPEHLRYFDEQVEAIARVWGPRQIDVQKHIAVHPS
jgi:hypothetical protein